MERSLGLVALVVRDYDEAMVFFTESLDFALTEDYPLGNGKRWVVVSPPGGRGANLLLARASGAEQERVSETRPAEGCFCSSIRTTSGETTDGCRSAGFDLRRRRATRVTE